MQASIRDEMTGFKFELGKDLKNSLFQKQCMNHFRRKEMLKSSIPIFIDKRLGYSMLGDSLYKTCSKDIVI